MRVLAVSHKRLAFSEPLWIRLACFALDSITAVLRFANHTWTGPSVLGTPPNDNPQMKAEHEQAGEFWCVYLGDE